MNNWEKLCLQMKPLISKGVTEDILHSQFESYLQTIFNWDKANIRHKPPVQIGRETKQADIVLIGNDFGIVIEMKRPDIELDDEAKSQLFSYMRILKHKYGFLIGNEMVIFYDDDTVDDPLEIARFGFDSKNNDGISLCEILQKEACSNGKLKEYMLTRIEIRIEDEKNKRLKNELLSNNGAKIKEILKQKLLSDGYKEEIINTIINDINIYTKNPVGSKLLDTPVLQQFNNTIEQFDHKCVIIKIKQKNVNRNNGDIYETVRRCWNNKKSTAMQADYVLAVVNGRVEEVYKPIEWYKEEDCKNCPKSNVSKPCGRIAFKGELADNEARSLYKGKSIPPKYRQKGSQNPVLFTYTA